MAGAVFCGRAEARQGGRHARRGCAAGGARQGPSVGVARRDQARPWADAFRVRRDGRGGARCRQLDRRVYRRAALARRGEGLCGRCRHQPAGVEASAGSRASSSTSRPTPATSTRRIIPEPVDIIVCDASFIGLAKVLEAPLKLAKPGAKLVALIKPQFEAGREEVGKGGVVRDPGGARSASATRPGLGLNRRAGPCSASTPKPDHRARRQCRIPAGSGKEWLKQ